jgi:hypothetical protein
MIALRPSGGQTESGLGIASANFACELGKNLEAEEKLTVLQSGIFENPDFKIGFLFKILFI